MSGMVNCHAHPTYCNMDDMYMLGETPVEEHVLNPDFSPGEKSGLVLLSPDN